MRMALDCLGNAVLIGLIFVYVSPLEAQPHTDFGPNTIDTDSGPLTYSEKYGYFKVGDGKQMFYWLYSAQSLNGTQFPATPSSRPLVVWLQVQSADILFIDAPVGTGFSYYEDEERAKKAPATTHAEVVKDVSVLLGQFFDQYPDYKLRPFHLFGQSYGGKVALHLAEIMLNQVIRSKCTACPDDINLKSVNTVSGLVTIRASVASYPDYLYSIGRINLKTKAKLDAMVPSMDEGTPQENAKVFFEIGMTMFKIVAEEGGNPNFYYSSKQMAKIEFYKEYGCEDDYLPLLKRMRDKEIDKINPLGGRNETYCPFGPYDLFKSVQDIGDSSLPTVERLLKQGKINVNIIHGAMDALANLIGADLWINSMNWSGLPMFQDTDATSLSVGDVPNGFIQSYGPLTKISVYRAGHSIPADNPKGALAALDYILAQPSPTPASEQKGTE